MRRSTPSVIRRGPAVLALAVLLAACQAETSSQPAPEAPAADVVDQNDTGDQSGAGGEAAPVQEGEVTGSATVVGADFFTIVQGRAEAVTAPFAGELLRLEVADGQTVSEGDVIARIATDRIGGGASIFGFRDTLDDMIVSLERQLERAERRLLLARLAVESIRMLDEERRQFPDDLPDREAERRALIGSYEQDLRRGRAVQLAPSREEVLELFSAVLAEQIEWEDALDEERQADRAVVRLREDLTKLRAQRGEAVLRAPQDGIFRLGLVEFSGIRPIEVGDTVGAGAPLGSVVVDDMPKVRVMVPDRWLPGLAVGDLLHLEFDGIPGRRLTGEITSISDSGTFSGFGTRAFDFFAGPEAFALDALTGAPQRRGTVDPGIGASPSGPSQSMFVLDVDVDGADRPALRPGLTGLATFPGAGEGYGFEVVAEVSEVSIHRITPGDPVEVELRAFPGQALDGTVVSVGRVPTVSDGEVTYRVILGLDTPPGSAVPLRTGLTGTVRFPSG